MSDKVIVSLVELEIDLYMLITEVCFIRNVLTSLYVILPVDETIL